MPEDQPRFIPDAKSINVPDAKTTPPFEEIQKVVEPTPKVAGQDSIKIEHHRTEASLSDSHEVPNTTNPEALRVELNPVSSTNKIVAASQPQSHVSQEKLKGFRQDPLRVLRNTFFYPTTEANVQIAVGAGAAVISSSLAVSALGFPEVAGVVAVAGEALIVGELASLFVRQKRLSQFLRVHKNRVTQEKILPDGTKIGLDDSVGELHVSGLTKLWKMRFEKDKTRRALVIMGGVLEGLVSLADKSQNDPSFQDFTAFKGTSYIVNPRIAEKFGFQVEKPHGVYGSAVSRYIRKLDRVLTLMPKDLGNQEINIAWISKEGLINHKGIIQDELDKIKRALTRRQ